MLSELINEHYHLLNENDHHVLNYISNNIETCIKSTVGEIAALCNVSPSTVSRTAQKLGFEGFSQFRYFLEEEVNRQRSQRKASTSSFQSSILLSDFSETVRYFEQSKNLDKIYELMLKADRIFAYGTGHAQNLMLREFARCLLNNNLFLNIIDTKTELALVQDNLTENDLLFVVSLSGKIDLIKPVLNNLVVKKVPMISVTLFSQNDLSYIADYNLYYHVSSFNPKRNINNSSFFTLNLVLALLYEGWANYILENNASKE